MKGLRTRNRHEPFSPAARNRGTASGVRRIIRSRMRARSAAIRSSESCLQESGESPGRGCARGPRRSVRASLAFRSPENHPVADAAAPSRSEVEAKPQRHAPIIGCSATWPSRSAARSAATETRVDGRRLQKVRVGKWPARPRWPDRCGLNLCRPEWCTGTAYSHWRNRRPSGYCLFAGASREPASNKCRMNSRGRSRLVL